MRKFLMVAALVSIAACGDKKAEDGTDTTVIVTPAPAPMNTDSMMRADSMMRDSMMRDSMMRADSMKARP